jgi:putative transposase
MPRKPRFYASGIAYHVAQCVGEQNRCFRENSDYRQCLDFILEASLDYDCDIHAYALTPDGIQLLIVPGDRQGIPRFMQSLARRYVAYFNHKYHRCGSLWKQRYRASAIDATRYLIAVSQYIEQHPVRLGYVEEPQAYRWSSYRCNALGTNDGITSYHRSYIQLGADENHRQACYSRLAEMPLGSILEKNIERCLTLGLPLGSTSFKRKLARTLNLQPVALDPGRRVKKNLPSAERNRDLTRSA